MRSPVVTQEWKMDPCIVSGEGTFRGSRRNRGSRKHRCMTAAQHPQGSVQRRPSSCGGSCHGRCCLTEGLIPQPLGHHQRWAPALLCHGMPAVPHTSSVQDGRILLVDHLECMAHSMENPGLRPCARLLRQLPLACAASLKV